MTLTGMPEKIASSMAISPARVPGSLDHQVLAGCPREEASLAAAIVPTGVVRE